MTTMHDQLAQRIWEHQRRAPFNKKPKTLSLRHDEWIRLLQECSTARDQIQYGPGTTKRFMGIRLRIRNYERERKTKWHGPGAQITART